MHVFNQVALQLSLAVCVSLRLCLRDYNHQRKMRKSCCSVRFFDGGFILSQLAEEGTCTAADASHLNV